MRDQDDTSHGPALEGRHCIWQAHSTRALKGLGWTVTPVIVSLSQDQWAFP